MITHLRSALHFTLFLCLILGATACGGLDGLTPASPTIGDAGADPGTDPADTEGGSATGEDAAETDPVDPSTVTCSADTDCAGEAIQAPDECMELFCDTAQGTCASRHVEDGTPCATGTCEGGKCVTPSECGDGVCGDDESAEDCAEDCAGTAGCGDGACDDSEDAESCPEDCAPAVVDCEPGQVAACDNSTCVDSSWVGDTICDDILRCEATNWDGGDCPVCGDGICDENQEDFQVCPGDCEEPPCPEDELLACDEKSCVSTTWVGDGVCDDLLRCEAAEWDGGDCCTDSQMVGCDGET